MPAFMLADVLRSVHYGLPSTLSTFESLSHPTPVNVAALSIYKATVIESQAPPQSLTKDASLLGLIAILADIHTFAHVFYILGTRPEGDEEQIVDLRTASLRVSTVHAPFTSSKESHLMSQRLDRALDLWASSYMDGSDKNTKVIFYLCKMYLAFPSMQMLPSLANYAPRILLDGTTNQTQQNFVHSELRNSQAALEYAWLILDNIDQRDLVVTPAWLPIAVFFASLLVWQCVLVQVGNRRYGSRKVLLLFREELVRMCWPCCKVMAATLDALAA
jgi:hypothetical protein